DDPLDESCIVSSRARVKCSPVPPPAVTRRVCLVALVLGLLACEGAPARSKPWRHAPDPAAEAEMQPRSDVVAREAARIEARQRREHTLRVHVDRAPRHLNPMVAPSVWTTRIAFDSIFEPLIRYEPPEGGAGAGPGHYRAGL